MSKTFQVVGACASFTTPTPNGPTKLTYYAGAMVPPDAPQAEVEHNLSVGLIREVSDDPYTTPVDGTGTTEGQAHKVAAERGRTETKTEGGRPAANAPKAEWVDYAVSKGMDRGEAEKASLKDLQAALRD